MSRFRLLPLLSSCAALIWIGPSMFWSKVPSHMSVLELRRSLGDLSSPCIACYIA